MDKIFFRILILTVTVAITVFLYLVYTPNSFHQPATVKIETGATAGQIGLALKSQGLIKSALVFKWYAQLTGSADKLVSGQHQIRAGSSISSIINQLKTNSNLSRENKITIIEGWRLEDIADYLDREGVVKKKDFFSAAKIENWRSQYSFLSSPKIKSLEGFLFPDTYNIFQNASAEEIIKKLLDEFDAKLTPQMRNDLTKQDHDLFDVVILASILEREVSNQPAAENDRQLVADIFWKRLAIGMGLQSDATINYITGKTSTRPTLKDLKIDSPYNTYKYRGLPPGPINNPSLASLKAVIYPQENQYYYFLTDKNGKAYFARTYAEHQQNIQKYLENK